MNALYLAIGLFLLAFGAIIPPPGFSPFMNPLQDIPVIAVKAPSHAIKMGYPKTVYFYEPYVKRRWGLAYMDLINDSFKHEGLYDYARGRIVSPEEVREGVIIGYLGRADMNIYSRISWPKVLFMALGAGFIGACFLETRGEERRVYRSEAEIKP